MADIRIVPLGAGQDVGRSCILLTIGGKNIMLDCGMHMGFGDERRFPDFTYINRNGPLTDFIDCVIISHFHLDHCGSLPYMSEMVGYQGPIYMTYPTKAICPILLEDYRKITVEQKGETNFFTLEMIKACMKKVIPVNLHQKVEVDNELSIKAYYAGHVIGAAMFHIQVGNQSVVYTGDYNMTPDRHLGAARIDKCRPDVLITESTYATTIRDSKRCREQDFLKKVHGTVEKGGKVLIPVFALGRAQELCILLETYWDQKNLKTPIYFTTGLTDKATNFYKLFITWTNEKIKNTFVERNMFDFKHISPFDRSLIDLNEPMVVFATPGMLHGGTSLQIFKRWCSNEKNMIIMPGYCVNGTVGWKILNGQKNIEIDKQKLEVKMSVEYMSFSAHADAKGIMQLVRQCEPKSVVLVHGEGGKMHFLCERMQKEFSIACYMPANGESIDIPSTTALPINMTIKLFNKVTNIPDCDPPQPKKSFYVNGILILKDKKMCLMDHEEAFHELSLKEHGIHFSSSLHLKSPSTPSEMHNKLLETIDENVDGFLVLSNKDGSIKIGETVSIKITTSENLHHKICHLSWSLQDDDIATFLINLIKTLKFS